MVFRICHVKGCDPSAVFGDCSVTSKEETLASSAVVVSFPVTGTRLEHSAAWDFSRLSGHDLFIDKTS